MLRVYLKTSLRHLSRKKIYAAINVIGLASGITAMLLAILFWRDEVSFDRFHTNLPHLYRITTSLVETKGAARETVGSTGQVQGPAFKAAIPEIKSYTRVLGGDIYSSVSANNKTLKVQPLFVDTSFLQIFTFPLIQGNPATALRNIESVVLTESTAKKLFNRTDVIGELLSVDADPSFQKLGKPLIISAVVKDPPPNSSLQFDLLYTNAFMRLSFEDEAWLNAYIGTFLLLEADANLRSVEHKMQQVFEQHAQQQLSTTIKQFGYDPQIKYGLQRVEDIHFKSLERTYGNIESGVTKSSNPLYSIVFLAVAAFILVMAAINFMNIHIAASIQRAKEVGVRKIAGGSRWQIIAQFLTEASLLCILSFAISIVAVFALLPVFSELTGKQLLPSLLLSSSVISSFILLLILLIGVTSIYPAIVLSRFNPVEVLYNRFTKNSGDGLRKLLVVVQFTPAVFMLIATIVYYSQVTFMRTKSLGYNPSQVIQTSVYGNRDYNAVIHVLKNEFAQESTFNKVAFGSNGYKDRMEINGKTVDVFRKAADENLIPLLEIPMVAGRNFKEGDAESGIIVNETFVRHVGVNYAVGARVDFNYRDEKFTRRIVGVVKDYHYNSPRAPILPMVMFMNKNPDGDIWIKVDQANMQQAITALARIYKNAMPSALFEYALMDETNAKDFYKEMQWQKIVTIGTVTSLVICVLGLFGLAHLSIYQRIKEIGIRKVLGASLSQLVLLLTAGFLKLVLTAIVIASPLALIAMRYWLQNYAYHIDIGPAIFLVAGLLAIGVAFLAISYQTFRLALTNPVKCLKSE